MNRVKNKPTIGLFLAFLLLINLSVNSMAQTFPFHDQQQMSPEQIKIHKYKMQRLQIIGTQDGWRIVQGINEDISDEMLLTMVNQTERLKHYQRMTLIGNSIAIIGLVLLSAGGILVSLHVSDTLKFENGLWYGIGAMATGGAITLAGEMLAVNIADENAHVLARDEAEAYVKEYNEVLKKELGLEQMDLSSESHF